MCKLAFKHQPRQSSRFGFNIHGPNSVLCKTSFPCIVFLGMSNSLFRHYAAYAAMLCSLLPKTIFLTFILQHCTWCKCRVAAVERLPVHHHSAYYISFRLGSFGPL